MINRKNTNNKFYVLKKGIAFLILVVFTTLSFSQNKRDLTIHESIYFDIYNIEKYYEIKDIIAKLEEQYGYEPYLKYILLQKSFDSGDIGFFKDQLTILVREYGFNIIYEPESKSYYEAITTGDLASWFKNMYLSNHFIWMENNFLKQIDLKKLNQLKDNDQLINKYHVSLRNKLEFDSIQKNNSSKHLNDAFFDNLATLYSITRKYNYYPSAKSFALVQNSFGIVEQHNYQSEQNFEKTWLLFEPFYKKAYLNNEIDYIYYKNYDNWSFMHYKNQRYGLIKIDDVPEIFKGDMESIPIRDKEFSEKIKAEFNWNKKF